MSLALADSGSLASRALDDPAAEEAHRRVVEGRTQSWHAETHSADLEVRPRNFVPEVAQLGAVGANTDVDR